MAPKQKNPCTNFSCIYKIPKQIIDIGTVPIYSVLPWLPQPRIPPRYIKIEPTQKYCESLVPAFKTELDQVASKYVFQLEDSYLLKTDEEKYELYNTYGTKHHYHFQTNLHSQTKTRTGTLANLWKDTEFARAQFSVCSSAGQLELKKYCMKSMSKVSGPWADHKIYRGEDIIPPSMFTEDQSRLERFLLTPPDGRSIIWVFDPFGAAGKTAFAKSCSFRHGWPVFTYARASDILYLVSKFQNRDVYMFNLSKTKPADISSTEVYNAFESIKDGMFTSQKFECLNVLMGTCHAVVFANHLPELGFMTGERFETLYWEQLPKGLVKKSTFDWGKSKRSLAFMQAQYVKANPHPDISAQQCQSPPRKKRRKDHNTDNQPPLKW